MTPDPRPVACTVENHPPALIVCATAQAGGVLPQLYESRQKARYECVPSTSRGSERAIVGVQAIAVVGCKRAQVALISREIAIHESLHRITHLAHTPQRAG